MIGLATAGALCDITKKKVVAMSTANLNICGKESI